jgi:predicted MFS family arabinose efflux permease
MRAAGALGQRAVDLGRLREVRGVSVSGQSFASRARAWAYRRIVHRLRYSVGGAGRLRAVVLLAAVLAVASADSATVGAVASQLEPSLKVGNGAIGTLVSVSTGMGALAALPIGVLVDRVVRTRLLTASLVVWAAAMIASGAAVSYPMLLFSRLALGAVVAAASPAVASLVGDLFPAADRGRVYGYVLAGELFGAGAGLLVGGDVAALLGWRAAFWVLAAPSLLLAAIIHRRLPEPARSGQGSTTTEQARQCQPCQRAKDADTKRPAETTEAAGTAGTSARREAVRQGLRPHQNLVLHTDPTRRSLWWVIRYVLSIHTNVALIVASGIGYFFFAGLRTFAVIFLQQRFGFAQAAASSVLVLIGAGAVIGVLVSGRIGDRLVRRQLVAARPVLAGIAFVVVAMLFVPALLTGAFTVAGPLLFLAAAALGATNPPLDAARLDIIHSRLWGRAESVRTVLRSSLQALAPVLFGYLSTALAPAGTHDSHAAALGLDRTFLIMLVPVVAAGLILVLLARRSYPRDVATAAASERATRPDAAIETMDTDIDRETDADPATEVSAAEQRVTDPSPGIRRHTGTTSRNEE